jgi:hypothetical protein
MASNETLEQLVQSTAPEFIPLHPEAERFIAAYNVVYKPRSRVYAAVVYYYYVQWKLALGETDIISRHVFFKGWGPRYKTGRDARLRFFRLDKTPFPCNKELLATILKEIKEEKEWVRISKLRKKVGKLGRKKRKENKRLRLQAEKERRKRLGIKRGSTQG